MKKIILLLSVILLFENIFGQTFKIKSDKINRIKNAVMIVALEEPDQKKIQKHQDEPDWQTGYLEGIKQRNELLSSVVKKYWTYNSKIEYMLFTAAEDLVARDSNYIMIFFDNYLKSQDDLYKFPTPNDNITTRTSPYHSTNKFHILSINNKAMIGIRTRVAQTSLPNRDPTYADIVYGIQQLQFCMRFRASAPKNTMYRFYGKYMGKRSCKLKYKTLLINKELIYAGLTEELIKTVYPYKFQITSSDIIDSAIIKKDTNYAFMQFAPSLTYVVNEFALTINNAEDGDVFYNQYIKLKDFKKIVLFINKYSSSI